MKTPNEKPILFSPGLVSAIINGNKTQTRRVIKPQPFNTRAKRQPVTEVSDYCTGIPEKGKAYYWRENGCWNSSEPFKSPYGQPGDELWVRETWRPIGWRCDDAWWKIEYKTEDEVVFRDQLYPPENPKDRDLHIRLADELSKKDAPAIDRLEGGGWSTKVIKKYLSWKPSIHMPRGASRIQLKVNDIWIERVQDITAEDAIAEGIKCPFPSIEIQKLEWQPIEAFKDLWNSINGNRDEGQFAWDKNPWVWVVDFEIKEVRS